MAMTIILTLISIVVGGSITFLVTRWYYARASGGDLEREANELKDYTVMLVNYLDDAGVIEVERDAQGNPIRVRVIKREVADSIDVGNNAEVRLTHEEVHQLREQNRPNS